ncbi:MAG: SUMF1/EgtB/PvdO family nonheme iron enzyme [Phaeodactylibacter sp.]|uniref:SUMF1/EgtB/PvdO family nonheme iron enzyme n=1 Tax=Phaeodactylibacter sp. TaxID=1940289 RepID=UPI0032EC1BD0
MIERLKQHIAKGRTEFVIQALLKILEGNNNTKEIRNEIILISSDYEGLKQEKRSNLYTANEIRIKENQLKYRLLQTIEELEGLDTFKEEPTELELNSTSSTAFTPIRYKTFFFIALSLIALVLISTFFFHDQLSSSRNLKKAEESPRNSDEKVKIPVDTHQEVVVAHPSIEKEEEIENLSSEPSKPIYKEDSTGTTSSKDANIIPQTVTIEAEDGTPSFKISATEVTVAQYLKFCQSTGYEFPANVDTTKKDHPITNVTFYDAAAYCSFVGGSLPTVRQWELAVNSYSRDLENLLASNQVGKVGWIQQKEGPFEVAQKQSTTSGIYDLIGNVREWCLDTFPSKKGTRITIGVDWSQYKQQAKVDNIIPMDENFHRSRSTGFRVIFH